MSRAFKVLLLILVLLWVTPMGAAASRPLRFDHVAVIMLENHSDQSIVGDPAAPTLTRYAHEYAYAANFYGVTHPSLPNYIALTSGFTWFSNSDDPRQRFTQWNIVDEFEAHHVSWKAYMQGLPFPGFTGNFYPSDKKNARYVIRHDPFMLYDDVRHNAERRASVVPLAQLARDARAGTLPTFIWISPDVCSDMHGTPEAPCPYAKDAALRRDGDDFVKRWVPVLLHAKGWTNRSVIFILTDETTFNGDRATDGWLSAAGCCDSPLLPPGTTLLPKGGMYGGGKIPFIAIGGHVRRHYVSHVPYNHYSLLRTLEDAWGLQRLGMTSDSNNVSALSDLFILK